jgi:hypothetical protein
MNDASIPANAPDLVEADHASRTSMSERSRRYRERRRAGKLVASVEIDESILAMLAHGTHIDAETLHRDRAQLNDAAHKALVYYAKRFAKTGSIKE